MVTNPRNVFYLTGFRGSAGVAAFCQEESRLWVDSRYTLQAREEARGVEVMEARPPLLKTAAAWLVSRKRPRPTGFEDSHLTSREHAQLLSETRGTGRWAPAGGLVEELRFVKDPSEIALIRRAARVTVKTFEEVLPLVRPGVREADLAAEIEYRMRRLGAEGAAFETIVASGRRGALPHARASCKLLEKNELVIFDLGAILGGYRADMTRTFFLGKPNRRIRALYLAVLEAQKRAVDHVLPGVVSASVDGVARRELARRGWGRYFTHSTGHGVGLEVHEKPRLGKGEKDRLMSGCVVTVEPGIYLEGLGGIRIEDTVLVGPQGAEILTPASKSDWYMG